MRSVGATPVPGLAGALMRRVRGGPEWVRPSPEVLTAPAATEAVYSDIEQ